MRTFCYSHSPVSSCFRLPVFYLECFLTWSGGSKSSPVRIKDLAHLCRRDRFDVYGAILKEKGCVMVCFSSERWFTYVVDTSLTCVLDPCSYEARA